MASTGAIIRTWRCRSAPDDIRDLAMTEAQLHLFPVFQALPLYDESDPRADQITTVIERLLAMTHEDRVASPCIGIERADLVLAGCAILEAIRRAFPCPRLRVADRGLREGMLVQMMREDGAWSGGNQATMS